MSIQTQCARIIARAKQWAIEHPGQEYRKTIIIDDGRLACVARWFYEEACIESEYFGEIFAIKEPGQAVCCELEVSRP